MYFNIRGFTGYNAQNVNVEGNLDIENKQQQLPILLWIPNHKKPSILQL